jgi:hypothetical protein
MGETTVADTNKPRLFIETLSASRAAQYRAHQFRIQKTYGVTDVGVAAMKRLDAAFGRPPCPFLARSMPKPFNRERFAAAERDEAALFASCYVTQVVRVPNYQPGFLSRRQAGAS